MSASQPLSKRGAELQLFRFQTHMVRPDIVGIFFDILDILQFSRQRDHIGESHE